MEDILKEFLITKKIENLIKIASSPTELFLIELVKSGNKRVISLFKEEINTRYFSSLPLELSHPEYFYPEKRRLSGEHREKIQLKFNF